MTLAILTVKIANLVMLSCMYSVRVWHLSFGSSKILTRTFTDENMGSERHVSRSWGDDELSIIDYFIDG